MQLNFATGALFSGVDDAGIEGAGIDVQTDGALVEFAGIEDAMHGLGGIDGAGLGGIHLDGFGGLDDAFSRGNVLLDDVEILDQQTADGDGHPAILIAVVVDGAGLADLPADGEQFVERSFIDEIASVVLAVPEEIGSERIGIERIRLEELAELFGAIEGGRGEFAEFGDEVLDGDLIGGGGHGLKGKYSAGTRAHGVGET